MLHSGSKHALLKTFGPCYGLSYAETIAVDSPLGYLDRSGFGSITYEEFPGTKRRCPIDRIVAVGSVKEARDLVAAEKAEKANANKTAAPPSGGGRGERTIVR